MNRTYVTTQELENLAQAGMLSDCAHALLEARREIRLLKADRPMGVVRSAEIRGGSLHVDGLVDREKFLPTWAELQRKGREAMEADTVVVPRALGLATLAAVDARQRLAECRPVEGLSPNPQAYQDACASAGAADDTLWRVVEIYRKGLDV